MPFDVIARDVAEEIDELAALGITPVPPKIVEAYKAKMLKRYKRATYPRWTEYRMLRDRIETSLARLPVALGLDTRSYRVGSAPASVIAIATLVRDTIPDSRFSVRGRCVL